MRGDVTPQERDFSICPIPHSRPLLGDDLEAAARAVSSSGIVGHGPEVQRFEQEMANLHDAADGIAVSSGTAALHLALRALGVGAGDEVLVPSYVCVSILNAVRLVGAEAVLVDSEPDGHNLDPADARRRLTRRARAIIAPHLFGTPANIGDLQRLGLPIVEDCAQALGASIDGRRVGSLGDIAVFSFYATKVITTGEGGMAITRDRRLASAMRDLRDYDERVDGTPRPNYHMSDLAAAVGRRQLLRLDAFVERRRRLARMYNGALVDAAIDLPSLPPGSIAYRYVVRVPDADRALRDLARRGVTARRPVHTPLHRIVGRDMPHADEAFKRSVSIPLYPDLSDAEADYVACACAEVWGRARRAELAAAGAQR